MAVLQVFVESDCGACRRALHLADQVRARFPELLVQVVNLSESEVKPPEAVFAVPTFLIDGEVLSLGNPRPADLMLAISARME
jgi:hypothetical protein